MDLQIKAAPKLRAREPRPRQLFLAPPPVSRGTGRKGLVLLVAVVAATAVWFALREPGLDPHLAAARQLVERYESGRSPERLNYGHPVYEQALAELAAVAPRSPWAEPAAALADSIRQKIAEFDAAQRREADRLAANRETKQQTRAAIFERQERVRLNPVTSYPECEREGGHAHGDGHSH